MASGRDGSIHVFDPSSTSPRVIDSTYRNSPQVSWMSVRGDGHLLVGLSTWQCEEFDEEGTHIRSLKGPVFLSFVPGTPRYWGFGGNVAALRDDAGVEVVRLERDAANHWLHFPRTGSVSPDGGLLLLQSELRRGARLNQVHVFDAAGKALNVISLPTSAEPQEVRLAWCGHTVAASTEEELLLFRDDGTPIGRQSLPRAFQEPRGVFFSPDERELWLFSERAEMLRLAVP
jgi:hypothetical protein